MSEHGHICDGAPTTALLPHDRLVHLQSGRNAPESPKSRHLRSSLGGQRDAYTSVRTIKSGRLRRVKRYYCCQTATIILSKPVKQRPFSIGFISTLKVFGSIRLIMK